MSFLCQFMEPDDLSALRTFMRKHDVLSTEVLDSLRFAALYLADLIKWPPAVAALFALLCEVPSTGVQLQGWSPSCDES